MPTKEDSTEPLHRRVLAPIIKARIKAIKAEDKRLKSIILAMPLEERNPYSENCLNAIEDREQAELLESILNKIALRKSKLPNPQPRHSTQILTMDYLTRRHARAAGHNGAFLRSTGGPYPRLSALGVRVEEGTVYRDEIAQALSDLHIEVNLPDTKRIEAAVIEAALAQYEPAYLRTEIDKFLDHLTKGAQK